ncbi:hypothetical protein BEP19_12235 [Ammoniphilus oxalaticus]|uniref:Uncharacterized protein n=1 Tax=Ammoniphilus oxalaticus TaxID=66863 RepID=A0A419SGT8_9BACL|nr:hypothetical protein [Ammoniphilus oxalaticus]RKD22993.1 hypothetical protein BEP19_12235 [Ammoniphilus oxalaticus]
MFKKVLVSLFVIGFIFVSIVMYNHNQEPSREDVFKSTKKWSRPATKVLFLERIDDSWLTIIRMGHGVAIARLEENSLGLWRVKQLLSSVHYPPAADDEEITWGASGDGQGNTYYFGQIINPKIKRLTVENKRKIYDDVHLFNVNGDHFFFKEVNEEMELPINIEAYSESGEVIYSSVSPVKK